MVLLNFDARKVRPVIHLSDALPPQHDAVSSDLSPGAQRLLNGFLSIPAHYKLTVTKPPGLVGAFVEAAMLASHRPFLKFAIPSTLATLSGIVGRRYKVDGPGSGGLAVNFILAAASGAGKSEAVKAWEGFCWAASKEVYPSQGAMPRRVHLHDTRSIQGIMEDFIECPAAVWANDEAGALLRAILSPSNRTDEELRDSFNRLFDASEHQRTFAPPKSVRLRNDGERPICNISMAVFLALPLSEFELPDANALNGFLARTLVIRHKGRTVKKVPHGHTRLPCHLHQRLADVIARAKEVDDLYSSGLLDAALAQSVHVDFSAVEELHATLDEELDELVQQGMDDGSVYTALNRASVLAKRIAGTLAVIENPNLPIVTSEEMQWAFGYVLQNFALILSDFDTGEVGDKASDEEEAVKRAVQSLLKSNAQWKVIGGVPKKKLYDNLKGRAPFKSVREKGKLVTATLDGMLANDILRIVPDPGAGAAIRRPITYLSLVTEP